jgi:hypothetical protein
VTPVGRTGSVTCGRRPSTHQGRAGDPRPGGDQQHRPAVQPPGGPYGCQCHAQTGGEGHPARPGARPSAPGLRRARPRARRPLPRRPARDHLEATDSRSDTLPAREREFLDASREAPDREQRREAERVKRQARANRRLRTQIAALAIALVAALAVGFIWDSSSAPLAKTGLPRSGTWRPPRSSTPWRAPGQRRRRPRSALTARSSPPHGGAKTSSGSWTSPPGRSCERSVRSPFR